MSIEFKDTAAEVSTPTVIDAGEFSVAEQEAAKEDVQDIYTYVHQLRRPFEYEGKTYETLTFDWGSLTGDDSLAIEAEMQAMGKPVIVPTFSGEYLIRMAARACTPRLGSDVLGKMPISEYNRIRSKARSFLLLSE